MNHKFCSHPHTKIVLVAKKKTQTNNSENKPKSACVPSNFMRDAEQQPVTMNVKLAKITTKKIGSFIMFVQT